MHLKGGIEILQTNVAHSDHTLVVQTAGVMDIIAGKMCIFVVRRNAKAIKVCCFVQLIKPGEVINRDFLYLCFHCFLPCCCLD